MKNVIINIIVTLIGFEIGYDTVVEIHNRRKMKEAIKELRDVLSFVEDFKKSL